MSFNTALSGMLAANADLNVTANNIANVNTTGFKESRAEFSDMFSRTTYGLSKSAIGTGVMLADVAQQFSQGNIDPTGRNLDMAISGEGFFTLKMNGAPVYSRAGNFQADNQGYVVTPEGANLQVYAPRSDGNGFDIGRLIDLQLSTADSPPKPTSTVTIKNTLPANAQPPALTPFDPADSRTYNESTGGLTIFDSLGVQHTQTTYYVKTAVPNQWELHNFIDGDSTASAPTLVEFSNTGQLISPANGQFTLDPFTPSTGAGVINITLDLSGSTQYGERFALRDTRQDGFAAGKLSDISISKDGVVFARYSNGADQALGQVALTSFPNSQGLQPQGNNVWTETYTSGQARQGAPDTSDFGQIQSGALEASTVDLTEQLVNMIVAQRNFQANSQMITTQDQITQTVINIR